MRHIFAARADNTIVLYGSISEVGPVILELPIWLAWRFCRVKPTNRYHRTVLASFPAKYLMYQDDFPRRGQPLFNANPFHWFPIAPYSRSRSPHTQIIAFSNVFSRVMPSSPFHTADSSRHREIRYIRLPSLSPIRLQASPISPTRTCCAPSIACMSSTMCLTAQTCFFSRTPAILFRVSPPFY